MKTMREATETVKKSAAALTAGALLLSAAPVRAFDEYPAGARPAAFSGAYAAVADDVHSLYYNPAGLAMMTTPQVTAYYARLVPGLSDGSDVSMTFLAYGQKLRKEADWGSMGVAWNEFRLNDLFRERTVTVGYAKTLSLPLLDIALGLNTKLLSRDFGEDAYTRNSFGVTAGQSDPVFNGGKSAQKVSFDLGAIVQPMTNLTVGGSLANVNTPDMGLSTSDRVPMVTRLGAAYKFPFLKAHMDVSRRRYLDKEADNRLMIGAERTWLFNRFGEVTARGGAGVGSRSWRQVSLGLGYEVNGIGVDYVYVIPMGSYSDAGNTHRVSLSFRFGKTPGEEELASLMRDEQASLARAEEALRLAQAEAQFITQDRNQLLQEMERLKAQIKAGAGAVQTPVSDGMGQAAQREQSARDNAQREFNAAYQAAMAAYGKKVQRGATLAERADILAGVLDKYTGKGVDMSRAKTELERVNSDLAQAQSDYRITLDFYKKTVADGADTTDRISLLERMSKKYGRAGMDISEVTKELEELKKKQ